MGDIELSPRFSLRIFKSVKKEGCSASNSRPRVQLCPNCSVFVNIEEQTVVNCAMSLSSSQHASPVIFFQMEALKHRLKDFSSFRDGNASLDSLGFEQLEDEFPVPCEVLRDLFVLLRVLPQVA